MNPSIESQLVAIKLIQNRLRSEFNELEQRIVGVEHALEAQKKPASQPPPVLHNRRPDGQAAQLAKHTPLREKVESMAEMQPPTFSVPTETKQQTLDASDQARSERSDGSMGSQKRSIEMEVGTTWFVRVGVVILITGLAFLGHFTYRNIVSDMGPAGKLSLMGLAVLGIFGFAIWIDRRSTTQHLKQYSQVLMAGGFAAGYFTTYAAHQFENLRVISSPLLDAVLLAAWAGGMLAWSHRRQSQGTAVIGACLAIYASILSEASTFTLLSNLVIAAGATWYMAVNNWHQLTRVAMAGAYGGYVYWKFFSMQPENAESMLWSVAYPIAYWTVFSTAGFLTLKNKPYSPAAHRFLVANNGAAYGLMCLTFLNAGSDALWLLTMVCGATLLGLSWWLRRAFTSARSISESYLTQGLLLTTLGLGMKWAGNDLALVYGVKSLTLILIGIRTRNRVLKCGGVATSTLSSVLVLSSAGSDYLVPLFLCVGAGFSSVWTHRNSQGAKHPEDPVWASFFWILSLVDGSRVANQLLGEEGLPLGLACLSILAIGLNFQFKMKNEFCISKVLLAGSVVLWALKSWIEPSDWMSYSAFGLLFATQIFLFHILKRQTRIVFEEEGRRILACASAIQLVLLLFVLLAANLSDDAMMVSAGLSTLLLTAYGLRSKWPELAAVSQFILADGVLELMRDPGGTYYGPTPALSPIVALWALYLIPLNRLQPQKALRIELTHLQAAYGFFAMVLSFGWLQAHADAWLRPGLMALTGWISLFFSIRDGHRGKMILTHAWTVLSVIIFILALHSNQGSVPIQCLFCLGLYLGERYQKINSPSPISFWKNGRKFWIFLTCLSFWFYASSLSRLLSEGFLITLGWMIAGFLILGLGLLIKEREYRWSAFLIIGAGLGRVLIHDVWELSLGYRIVTLLITGVTFLVSGFIYNRYQEKMKQWL